MRDRLHCGMCGARCSVMVVVSTQPRHNGLQPSCCHLPWTSVWAGLASTHGVGEGGHSQRRLRGSLEWFPGKELAMLM